MPFTEEDRAKTDQLYDRAKVLTEQMLANEHTYTVRSRQIVDPVGLVDVLTQMQSLILYIVETMKAAGTDEHSPMLAKTVTEVRPTMNKIMELQVSIYERMLASSESSEAGQ